MGRRDGEEVHHALAPRGAKGVSRVVDGGPHVFAIRHATAHKLVERALPGV